MCVVHASRKAGGCLSCARGVGGSYCNNLVHLYLVGAGQQMRQESWLLLSSPLYDGVIDPRSARTLLKACASGSVVWCVQHWRFTGGELWAVLLLPCCNAPSPQHSRPPQSTWVCPPHCSRKCCWPAELSPQTPSPCKRQSISKCDSQPMCDPSHPQLLFSTPALSATSSQRPSTTGWCQPCTPTAQHQPHSSSAARQRARFTKHAQHPATRTATAWW